MYQRGVELFCQWSGKDIETILEERDDLTIVQATIGYIWAKNDQTFPIPGAKTVQQITENSSCLNLGPISNSLMKEIDGIFVEQQSDFSYETFPYYKQK